ncbi:MAG TPA: flagellar biosynthesis protein FlgE [Desulfosporosinus sp.]|jgi:flagellar hook protein FlgE|nr:flagellar biosynthesis protein FlgE [Desulfosporosinus sp.]
MMRSLYSAISGLKNHQVKMDVIGNNIANVNTTGFKRSRVTFATTLSQTMKGASSPSPNQGGTNPMQVGLGSMLASIDQIMTQGSSQSTGKSTDLMLQGPGLFVMNNGGQQVFTRAGGFSQDSEGTLEDPATGAKVQGYSWAADDSVAPVFSGAGYGDIKFALGDKLATDSSLPVAELTLGVVAITVTPPALPTLDTAKPGAEDLTIEGMTRVADGTTPASGQYSFNQSTGIVTFASDMSASATPGLTINYVAATAPLSWSGLTATVNYAPVPGAIVYTGTTNPLIPYTLTTAATPGTGEYAVKAVNGKYQIAFGQYSSGTTATNITSPLSYDFENKAHTLEGFSIDQSGVITGVYSNGSDSTTHKIAQIAVAKFANDAGLQNTGGSFYSTTNNSGQPSIGAAGMDGRASLVPNAIEMSNVDLSQEFTDMIVAQRGFQANSRVITVSDSLLQELIDLKRN